ncbi:Endoribonuclease L-PSP/chorismate mutase-like domain-containing protein [Bordetella tumbae]|uniref:RidA family protein n=1 Tax=Bordetella tumbae TaxID=1649139 RepID=UPI0039EE18F7
MSTATLSARLRELGMTLPSTNPPRGAYVPAMRAGDLLFIAGQAPRLDGVLKFSGRVGRDISIEAGREAAQICALNVLGHLAHACDDQLDRVVAAVRLAGVVNCAEDFTAHSQVLDGASELIAAVLGDRGRHARIATGASSLPSGMAVEVEAIFQLKS